MTWLRKLFAKLAGTRTVHIVCGRCHEAGRAEPGDRQQLFVELWDNYGQMYEKWPVGEGELLNTRTVDFELLREIRQRVQHLNALRRRA